MVSEAFDERFSVSQLSIRFDDPRVRHELVRIRFEYRRAAWYKWDVRGHAVPSNPPDRKRLPTVALRD